MAAGLSQEELAARAGLHRTYVSSLERGDRNVAVENIFALAAALGCKPGDLVNLLHVKENDPDGTQG